MPKAKHILIKKLKYSLILKNGSICPAAKPVKNLSTHGSKK
jgi:hypothetical protein